MKKIYDQISALDCVENVGFHFVLGNKDDTGLRVIATNCIIAIEALTKRKDSDWYMSLIESKEAPELAKFFNPGRSYKVSSRDVLRTISSIVRLINGYNSFKGQDRADEALKFYENKGALSELDLREMNKVYYTHLCDFENS